MVGFLDLPRESRDEIYIYYAAQDGGYVYNQRTHRLRAANDSSIDVSLIQTCSQVAYELRPIMFQSNTVTFRTGWVHRETSDRAAKFALALDFIHKILANQLFKVRESITDGMIDHVGTIFPQCVPMLRLIPNSRSPSYLSLLQNCRLWRQPPSTYWKSVQFILSLVKGNNFQQPKNFTGGLAPQPWLGRYLDPTSRGLRYCEFRKDDEALGQRHREPDISSPLTRIPEPWIIPAEDDIALLKDVSAKARERDQNE